MTDEKRPTILGDVRRLRKYAATIGVVVAIFCHILPPHYRAPCDALASFCTGGF